MRPDRVSSQSWYRSTRFDDKDQNVIYQKCQVPDLARRVKHGLAFLIVGSILFLAYFVWVDQGGNVELCHNSTSAIPTISTTSCDQAPQIIWISLLLVVAIFGISVTQISSHPKFAWLLTHRNLQIIGGSLVLVFAVTNWTYAASSMGQEVEDIRSTNRHLASWVVHIQVTLLLYTCIRLPIIALIALGIGNSIVFEVLLHVSRDNVSKYLVCAEVFLLLANHLICAKHCLQTDDDLYVTYEGVLDVVKTSKRLDDEVEMNRALINSVMPAKMTEKVMDDLMRQNVKQLNMRTFHASETAQKHVTILFADIVGFTRLSSGLTAAQLVSMLNDLYGRFDFLCEKTKCEKVAILGDCYYCVSGCPEEDKNHAYNCVKMGLSICRTIKLFCNENPVAVNAARRYKLDNPDFEGQIVDMRVGVHSGRVISAIVGSSRYKFDVYSQDVLWANKLESTGVAGRVHVSGCTRAYLRQKDFELEDGDPRKDTRVPNPRPVEEWLKLFERQQGKVLSDLKTRFEQLFEGERKEEIEEMDITTDRCKETTWLVVDPGESEKHEHSNDEENANGHARLRHTVVEDSTKVALLEKGLIPEVGDEVVGPKKRPTAIALIKSTVSDPTVAIEDHSEMYEYFRQRSDLSRKELNPVSLNFVRQGAEREEMERKREESVPSPPGRLHGCKQFCDTELPKYERQYRDGFMYIKGRRDESDEQQVNGTRKSKSDEQDDYEDTFPLARFRKDIVLCIVTQALLYVAVLLSIGYSVASLVTFLFCFFLSGLFLFAVSTKRLKNRVGPYCLSWTCRHVVGAFLLLFPSLPAIVAAFFIPCYPACSPESAAATSDDLAPVCQANFPRQREMLIAVLSASALHHTNFSNLSSNMRSAIGFLILVTSFAISAFYMDGCLSDAQGVQIDYFQWTISLFLLLLLILLENRSYEISHRLNFKAKVQTKEKRRTATNYAKLANSLLTNIIPDHVREHIRLNEQYSQNHPMVGVFFATITNFLELYDEQYAEGVEFIRTLNELICDIDDLLKSPNYSKYIEKIKTTSATYMGASGLNATEEGDNHHLEMMIEYCLDIERVVEDFNKNMPWFDFKVRIGAHCGEVTAGLIGTRKLLFDIIGNTVNVASRMDSTGICGCIQVTEDLKDQLTAIRTARGEAQRYMWNPRGRIQVKGKGMIETYLLEKETNL